MLRALPSGSAASAEPSQPAVSQLQLLPAGNASFATVQVAGPQPVAGLHSCLPLSRPWSPVRMKRMVTLVITRHQRVHASKCSPAAALP